MNFVLPNLVLLLLTLLVGEAEGGQLGVEQPRCRAATAPLSANKIV